MTASNSPNRALIEIGRLAQDRGAFGGRRLPRPRCPQSRLDIVLGALRHAAGAIAGNRRIDRVEPWAFRRLAGDDRPDMPLPRRMRRPRRLDRRQIAPVMQIPAAGIAPLLAIERGGRDHRRIFSSEVCEWVGGHRRRWNRFIDDAVDEGRIGAVLQKPPHQIGQKVAMRSHRGIDPAPGAAAFRQEVVQRLAHSMQTLEFEALRIVGHFEDDCRRMGVVGGELRVNPVSEAQQLAGAANPGNIAAGLGGKHRKAGQALDLGPA